MAKGPRAGAEQEQALDGRNGPGPLQLLRQQLLCARGEVVAGELELLVALKAGVGFAEAGRVGHNAEEQEEGEVPPVREAHVPHEGGLVDEVEEGLDPPPVAVEQVLVHLQGGCRAVPRTGYLGR